MTSGGRFVGFDVACSGTHGVSRKLQSCGKFNDKHGYFTKKNQLVCEYGIYVRGSRLCIRTVQTPRPGAPLKSGRTFSPHELEGDDPRTELYGSNFEIGGFTQVRTDFQLARAQGRRPQNRARKAECESDLTLLSCVLLVCRLLVAVALSVPGTFRSFLFEASFFFTLHFFLFGRRPKNRSFSTLGRGRGTSGQMQVSPDVRGPGVPLQVHLLLPYLLCLGYWPSGWDSKTCCLLPSSLEVDVFIFRAYVSPAYFHMWKTFGVLVQLAYFIYVLFCVGRPSALPHVVLHESIYVPPTFLA